MLKVKFENHSSSGVYIFGSPQMDIPGHAVGEKAVTVELPETPASEALVNDLKRRYPAMVISIVDDEGGATPLVGGGDEQGGEGDENTGSGDEGEDSGSNTAAIVTEDTFRKNVVNVEKKAAGWHIVTVTGLEPVKVQVKADADPIAAAYAEYAKAGE